MILDFIISGNQEDPAGNPIPKVKLTRQQQWNPKAQRYAGWKQYVQAALQPHLIALAADMPVIDAKKILKGGGRYLKPITLSGDLRMDIMIFWADETHADPESIYGSIADAIFVDDKHLKGSFDFSHAEDKKGRVEVKITIPDHE